MTEEYLRILLVEDSPTDVFLLKQALGDAGINHLSFVHVERLTEAIDHLMKGAFDMVLLDLGLPDSFGLETFERLQQQAPPIATVVLTNLNDETLAVKALQLGAQDFLVKGEIDGRILARSIRYSVERSRLLVAEQQARFAAESAEENLKKALAEKNLLIQEVHHRVKNNLQVISSLLALQSRYINDAHAAHVFSDSINRVRSMALVHEMLYSTGDITKIELGDYIERLIQYLISTYNSTSKDIAVDYQVGHLVLDLSTAAPLGLMLNEIISNCLKHAFQQEPNPAIHVRSASEGSDIKLIVRDNGSGMPPQTNWKEPQSFGLRLINLLAGQINATLHVDVNHGTTYTIQIPSE